jgi:hypothetical protein
MKNSLLSQSIIIPLFFSVIFSAKSQVPKMGVDSLLDVACWNLEWFGNTSNGPTNEALQFDNVKQVLLNTDFDVWGLCEVSDFSTYMNLQSQLPKYQSVLASFSQTQKTALFYKKDMFDLISFQHVLSESVYNYNLAGRPPLEVVLKTTNRPVIDTICFLVVHLKAMADQDSYDRRKNASIAIKNDYLDKTRKQMKTIMLGDWNDDLDLSTFNNQPSPFQNFVQDTNYFFTTKLLSEAGKKTYAFIEGSFIDHIMINRQLKSMYMPASTKVLDMMPSYISNFSNNTSDHYPVVSYFNLNSPAVLPTSLPELDSDIPTFTYDAQGHHLLIETHTPMLITIYDISGKQIIHKQFPESGLYLQPISDFIPGFYIMQWQTAGQKGIAKFIR